VSVQVIDFLGPLARPSGVRIMKQDRVQNQVWSHLRCTARFSSADWGGATFALFLLLCL
jgi:hypothetical protein